MEAMYYETVRGGVRCLLCPYYCLIHAGKTGICKVRHNVQGKLMAETWGHLSAVNVDPIEKKPLYHYNPGKTILSLGSVGCNMKCPCCQNWQISQSPESVPAFDTVYDPTDIIRMALSHKDNIGVAYTYNEPTIWFEYMIDIARLVHAEGLSNVMVSNGYINEEPLHDLLTCIDAFNIDLKGFSADFYRKFTGATLFPVLRTLKQIIKAGKHLEVTFLVIPTLNDDLGEFNEMVSWIAEELGDKTVLHLSRYHPAYKLGIEATTSADLENLYVIARKKLCYVYVGNIQLKDYQDTHCSNCGKGVILRVGYQVNRCALTDQGVCKYCGNQVTIN
jgi:pyruvate formate lyase activating enzyme